MQKLDKIKQIRSEAGSKGGRPKTKTKPKENQLLNKSKTNETNKSKVNKSKVNKYRDNVSMSEDEYNKLIDKYGKSLTGKCLDKLDNYKAANGKRYKSDYRAILSWVVDSIPKDKITTSIYQETN